MNKSNQSHMVMGVAVYLPHQWERLLATAEDRENLEGTWEEWRAVLDESERNMRAIGIEPVEVLLDMDDYEKYCAERGLSNVGGTRAEYVAELLAKQAQQ
ncbi:MAG: hypothetical protein AB1817_09595 [Chloroflexota bacterium]